MSSILTFFFNLPFGTYFAKLARLF